MISHRRIVLVVIAALLVMPFAGAAAASPASASDPQPVGADVITQVDQFGFRVAAVAVEYSRVLTLAANEVPTTAFEVIAQLGDDVGPRTVISGYTSKTPGMTTPAQPGRYVILELDPNDANAYVTYDDGGTRIYPLEGAYTTTQVEDLVGPNGKVRVPAGSPPVTNDGVLNPVVDDFGTGSFAGTSGTVLPYRLFTPDAPGTRGASSSVQQGKTYPLVVFLHGGGERATDNLVHIVANESAVAFARPDRQATDPSFVLAPQTTGLWFSPAVHTAVVELIEQTVESHPIDTDRIYVTGLSLGAWGMYNGLLPNNPDLFAAAIAVCGTGNAGLAPSYADVPIWATHSRDDGILSWNGTNNIMNAIENAGTPVTRAEWAGNLEREAAEDAARAHWAAAEAEGSHTLFTTFTTGTTPVNPHFSWIPTYSNDVILDWLFAQSRGD
jgi:predicted peptidase